jgi:hypothetical protein
VFGYEVSGFLFTMIWRRWLTVVFSLALCELNLCLAALVLRVIPHMRLSDTTEEDVAYDHDMFVPMTKDNRGVRVTIE